MSTIRDTYPTKINNVTLFRPEKWELSEEVIEQEFRTEAGTDNLLVERYGKTTISAEFSCTDVWQATFAGWSKTASLTVKYYEPESSGYVEKSMRMRNFKSALVPASDYLTDSQSLGLYTVSFDLIEF